LTLTDRNEEEKKDPEKDVDEVPSEPPTPRLSSRALLGQQAMVISFFTALQVKNTLPL